MTGVIGGKDPREGQGGKIPRYYPGDLHSWNSLMHYQRKQKKLTRQPCGCDT